MKQPSVHFDPPGIFARAVNRLYGRVTSLGLGPSDSYLLQTHGRKSGTTYSTPVNVLRFKGKIYLIGTRGHQWSRNVWGRNSDAKTGANIDSVSRKSTAG
jgi:hypothetical protein